MLGLSREDFSQQLTKRPLDAGYRPAHIEVMRGAVCVWFWVGATAIQISHDAVSDMRASLQRSRSRHSNVGCWQPGNSPTSPGVLR